MKKHRAILIAAMMVFTGIASAEPLPLSDNGQKAEALRNAMTAIMDDYAASSENQAKLKNTLGEKQFTVLSGIHAELKAPESRKPADDSEKTDSLDETGILHIRRYYLSLNDLTRHFIHDMQPVLRRSFFDALKEGKVAFDLPETIPPPMTELEEFETMEQVLKLPPVKLRPLLIAMGLQPNAFFEMDDDTRFMEFAIAADQIIQRQICALLPSVIPWRTFDYTDNDGNSVFGVLALFCPGLRMTVSSGPEKNDIFLQPDECMQWLQPPLSGQEGIRVIRDSKGNCHLLGIGRVLLPVSGPLPSTKAERLAVIRKREVAIDEARRRAISALQIHLAMTNFFSSEASIGTLLENYRATGFGNYSFENSLEASFQSLPRLLAAQTPLPDSLFKMLLQTEEPIDENSIAILVIMGY